MKKLRTLLFAVLLGVFVLGNVKANAATAPVFISDFEGDLTEGTSYIAVVNGYDWGPAIDKLVLKGENLPDGAVYKVTTSYTGYSGKVTEERNVLSAYVCDENGNAKGNGGYVALEVQVGPDLAACNAFTYDMNSGLNDWAKDYSILISCEDAGVKIGKCEKVVCPQADQFEMGTYTTKDEVLLNDGLDNDTLSYAYWAPGPSASENKKPLIIWIHGAGEGGTDPYIAILGNRVVNLISDEVQGNFEGGAYVFAPQTPTVWMNVNGQAYNLTNTSFTSMYTGTLYEMLMDFVESHPDIDTDRIYIGGCSNGGYMTMNMIVNFPDTFAAAYPVCEAYSNSFLSDEAVSYLKDMPIWFTHATNDSTVAIADVNYNWMTGATSFKYDEDGNIKLKDDFSRAAYRRLTEAGASDVHFFEPIDVHDTTGLYNEYQYMGHYSWIYVLKNESVDGDLTIFKWMSEKKLSDRTPAALAGTPWEVYKEKLAAKADQAAVAENEAAAEDAQAEENAAETSETPAEANVKSGSNVVIIVIIVAAALLICGVVAVFAVNRRKKQ